MRWRNGIYCLEELMQEERAEGLKEGLTSGHNQAMSFCILALLEKMEEKVPENLRKQINGI